MTEYAGAGDPQRTVEVLWGTREPPARGPKGRTTVPAIVRAAITVADAHGLAALSMRRIADELGVGTMSLYTYVPGKAELLDAMVDTVRADTTAPASDAPWRGRLEHIARDNLALVRRHPWLTRVVANRAVLGPNTIAKYDRELHALDGLGLADTDRDAVLTLVLDYTHAAARSIVDADDLVRQTGMTDGEWWAAHGPALAGVLDPDAHPLAARVGAATGEQHDSAVNPLHAFEFGLQRVLDGIGVFLGSQ